MRLTLFAIVLGFTACHSKDTPKLDPPKTATVPADGAQEGELALSDLKSDLKAAQSALESLTPTGYRCDRLMVSVKALESQKDAALQQLISDARTFCGLKSPLTQADGKLKQTPPDCKAVKEQLARISSVYRGDAQVVELKRRFKAMCPHERRRENSDDED